MIDRMLRVRSYSPSRLPPCRRRLRPDHGIRLPQPGHDLRLRQRRQHGRARPGGHGLHHAGDRRQAVQGARPVVRQSRARRQRHIGLHRRAQAGAAVAARGRQEDRGDLQRRRPELELHPDRRPLREAHGPRRRAVRRLRHRDERAGRQGPALGLTLVGVAGREVCAALRLERRQRQAPTAPSSPASSIRSTTTEPGSVLAPQTRVATRSPAAGL